MTVIIALAAAVASAAAIAGFAIVSEKRRRARRLEAERAAGERRASATRVESTRLVDEVGQLARTHVARLGAAWEADVAALDADEERLGRLEGTFGRRAEAIEDRASAIDERFGELDARVASVTAAQADLDGADETFEEMVERLAGVRRETIADQLAEDLTEAARFAARRAARALEEGAAAHAELEAKRLIDVACQRYGDALPANRLQPSVTLPKKGAARDALLADGGAMMLALGAELEVTFQQQDDDVVYLQAPDPFTREIARLAYERTVRAGKPTPQMAQAMVAKARQDLDKIANDAGRRAARILKLKGMHPEILYLVGKLLYRTSYTQNQWQHAIETAHLCGMMAQDLGMDVQVAHRSALIHDIGKVLWAETEAVGSHAVSGAAFARDRGETAEIVHPIAAHHGDEKPSTPLAHLVAAADALSGARPGARRETIESYSGRVEQVEAICADFRGIRQSYVIQGGREVRILVDPRQIDDRAAARMSEDVAHRIEDECIYPGQIKVTVIREIRSQAVAR